MWLQSCNASVSAVGSFILNLENSYEQRFSICYISLECAKLASLSQTGFSGLLASYLEGIQWSVHIHLVLISIQSTPMGYIPWNWWQTSYWFIIFFPFCVLQASDQQDCRTTVNLIEPLTLNMHFLWFKQTDIPVLTFQLVCCGYRLINEENLSAFKDIFNI